MPIELTLINPPLNEITIELVKKDPSLDATTDDAVTVETDTTTTTATVTVDPAAGLTVITEGAQTLSKEILTVSFSIGCDITMLTGTLWWKLSGTDKASFNLANDRITMTGTDKEGSLTPPVVVHTISASTPTSLTVTTTCGTIGSVFWHLVSNGGPLVSTDTIADDSKAYLDKRSRLELAGEWISDEEPGVEETFGSEVYPTKDIS